MSKLDEIRDEAAKKYMVDNNLDYQKYKDKRGDRSAYDSLMNYEITGLVEDAYTAGWDAAMERAQPIIEALEFYSLSVKYHTHWKGGYGIMLLQDHQISQIAKDDGKTAKDAIIKFYGNNIG